MRILVAGGGSGGHVTPVLAILEALSSKEPKLEICFVCDKKFAPQAQTILARSSLPITFKTVSAGKLRRYHGVPLWKQLLDIPTMLLNLRDLFLISVGILQSRRIMKRFKPDVVFGKGGFVCLPVGVAAQQLGVPLVIHDSDAHPGLTNRILARWATFIATGSPLEHYNYDPSRSHYVGIPVGKQFRPATPADQRELKQKLMRDPKRALVAVVGGGLGARPLNNAVLELAPTLHQENIEVILVAGVANGKDVLERVKTLKPKIQDHIQVEPFIDAKKMATLLRAADVVVSRGGATAMAELTLLGKATILVPNARLTGGQQVKNARALEQAQAVVIVDDEVLRKDSTKLEQALLWIVKNKQTRRALEEKIKVFAKPKAAVEVAKLIVKAGQGRTTE